MVFCVSCDAEVEGVDDEANGFTCCAYCGRVLEDIAFASDVQFAKGGDGSGGMMGQMVGESGQVKGLGRFSGGQVWASNVRKCWRHNMHATPNLTFVDC